MAVYELTTNHRGTRISGIDQRKYYYLGKNIMNSEFESTNRPVLHAFYKKYCYSLYTIGLLRIFLASCLFFFMFGYFSYDNISLIRTIILFLFIFYLCAEILETILKNYEANRSVKSEAENLSTALFLDEEPDELH